MILPLRKFPTGSRVYGTPHADSDYDWVIFGTAADWERLKDLSDDPRSMICDLSYAGTHGLDASIRFGKINLICISEEWQWLAWEWGTRNLTRRKPVTRPEAVAEFQHQFAQLKPLAATAS